MGEMRVPAAALYGAQTARAIENFPISGRALSAILPPRAGADQERRRPGQWTAWAICPRPSRPPSKPPPSRWPKAGTTTEFPLDIFQTGSGTSTNMNANEVHRPAGGRASQR